MSRLAGDVHMDPLGGDDDMVAAFQLEGRPVRGRIARLGAAGHAVLSSHNYPPVVSELLGEALALTVLVGASLKFDGKLIIQTQGDGPVPLLVVEYATNGDVRAAARVNRERLADVPRVHAGDAQSLLGAGQLAMTIDRGADFDRYQSLAPIEGVGLAQIAENYFEQSEQVPTRIHLAAGRDAQGHWRCGGAILQRIAGDEARGDSDEAWEEGRALFETVEADELINPHLSAGQLLFRLFHENGVRVFTASSVRHHCGCSGDKVRAVLARFPRSELDGLTEEDGRIAVRCEFCSREYRFTPDEVSVGEGG